uniref:Interactor of constitutive active ROPs 3-like n=1 Tax=Rhizophora mucronata TaxID=61149 RepID=A0A2P2JZF2_RHIMU
MIAQRIYTTEYYIEYISSKLPHKYIYICIIEITKLEDSPKHVLSECNNPSSS